MKMFDGNFGHQVFFMKSSKITCAVRREEFPPVRLNSHRHVARQQIFTYSPFACNNNNWFFSFSLNISLAPDCCNCLQHFMYFLCLPPSGPLSTGMQGQKSLFDTFWTFFGHFFYCLDSFWTIWTNYWLLREFEYKKNWQKYRVLQCCHGHMFFFWLHCPPIPDMTGK